MNKEDIKKAFDICFAGLKSCNDCPLLGLEKQNGRGCKYNLFTSALDLITEQEKEIERLKAENARLTAKLGQVLLSIDTVKEMNAMCNIEEQVKQAKIDVLNELRAHLYAVYGTNTASSCYVYDTKRVPLGNKTAEDIVKNIDELIEEIEK